MSGAGCRNAKGAARHGASVTVVDTRGIQTFQPLMTRVDICRRAYEICEERNPAIAEMIARETGKTIREAIDKSLSPGSQSFEQALYEMHDPAAYVTPDCVLDITQVKLRETGRDRVAVEGAGLDPYEVGPLLHSTEATLREAASWLVGRHPEWGDALADGMAARLESLPDDADARLALASQLSRFAGQPGIQSLLAKTASGGSSPAAVVAMTAMRDSGLRELPPDWVKALLAVMERPSSELGGVASSVVKSVPPRKDDTAKIVAKALKVPLVVDKRLVGPLDPGLVEDILDRKSVV